MKSYQIGVLDLMPQAHEYMPIIRDKLSDDVELIWIRIDGHPYKSTDQVVLANTHISVDAAFDKGLDALIITGAPLDRHHYDDVHYWQQLQLIITRGMHDGIPLLGLCWGAMAIGKSLYNIEKIVHANKLFGVYKMKNLAPNHVLYRNLDDEFWCPQSRYASLDNKQLEKYAATGELILLDYDTAIGFSTIATPDAKVVMHQGHFEYPTLRLAYEYKRDQNVQTVSHHTPINYSVADPTNNWRANAKIFFDAWVNVVKNSRRKT
jgi:homoserine O-succinyltransferase